MQKLRAHPPSQVRGIQVVSMEDFSSGSILPKSDVLRFWLADRSKLVVRPSGTEPKIKIYAEAVKKAGPDIESDIKACDEHLSHLVQSFRDEWLS